MNIEKNGFVKLAIMLIEFLILNTVIVVISLCSFFILFIPCVIAMIYYYDNTMDRNSAYERIQTYIRGFKIALLKGVLAYLVFGLITTMLFFNLLYGEAILFNNTLFYIINLLLFIWSVFALIMYLFISAKYKVSKIKSFQLSYWLSIYNFGIMVVICIGLFLFGIFSILTVGFILIYIPLTVFAVNKVLSKSLEKIFIIESELNV